MVSASRGMQSTQESKQNKMKSRRESSPPPCVLKAKGVGSKESGKELGGFQQPGQS